MIKDVASQQAWQALESHPEAQLVDVRTNAEWMYVGIPDLSSAAKRVHLVEWQTFPTGAPNPQFLQQLTEAGIAPAQPVYFICRSGARSRAAAEAAQAAGFAEVYNVADGFEGPQDQAGHRGALSGWKASDLPWQQR